MSDRIKLNMIYSFSNALHFSLLRYPGVDCQNCNCAISPDKGSEFHQRLFDAGIQSALYRLLFCFVCQKPAGCMRQHCRWSPAPRSIPSIRISGVFIWCVTMSMTLEKFWDTHKRDSRAPCRQKFDLLPLIKIQPTPQPLPPSLPP